MANAASFIPMVQNGLYVTLLMGALVVVSARGLSSHREHPDPASFPTVRTLLGSNVTGQPTIILSNKIRFEFTLDLLEEFLKCLCDAKSKECKIRAPTASVNESKTHHNVDKVTSKLQKPPFDPDNKVDLEIAGYKCRYFMGLQLGQAGCSVDLANSKSRASTEWSPHAQDACSFRCLSMRWDQILVNNNHRAVYENFGIGPSSDTQQFCVQPSQRVGSKVLDPGSARSGDSESGGEAIGGNARGPKSVTSKDDTGKSDLRTGNSSKNTSSEAENSKNVTIQSVDGGTISSTKDDSSKDDKVTINSTKGNSSKVDSTISSAKDDSGKVGGSETNSTEGDSSKTGGTKSGSSKVDSSKDTDGKGDKNNVDGKKSKVSKDDSRRGGRVLQPDSTTPKIKRTIAVDGDDISKDAEQDFTTQPMPGSNGQQEAVQTGSIEENNNATLFLVLVIGFGVSVFVNVVGSVALWCTRRPDDSDSRPLIREGEARSVHNAIYLGHENETGFGIDRISVSDIGISRGQHDSSPNFGAPAISFVNNGFLNLIGESRNDVGNQNANSRPPAVGVTRTNGLAYSSRNSDANPVAESGEQVRFFAEANDELLYDTPRKNDYAIPVKRLEQTGTSQSYRPRLNTPPGEAAQSSGNGLARIVTNQTSNLERSGNEYVDEGDLWGFRGAQAAADDTGVIPTFDDEETQRKEQGSEMQIEFITNARPNDSTTFIADEDGVYRMPLSHETDNVYSEI
ncbi:sex determining protein [Elysia marginata]|uniref:Sex determining protein n=1 Tax=Elysia marginata TaxID=1093978 RepID=A0AAV4J173_9GAST|nr:sex determining protein [Elysia marginata]